MATHLYYPNSSIILDRTVTGTELHQTVINVQPDKIFYFDNTDNLSQLTSSDVLVGSASWATYADTYAQMTFGQEYLSHFHLKLMNGSTPNVIFSGDSTTNGGNISDAQNYLHNIFKYHFQEFYPNISCSKHGHDGSTVDQWNTTYMPADLALNPDLYILRWGMNPSANLTAFSASLSAGLQTLRATKAITDMSIVLMTPNCANDTAHGRDFTYLESINPIIRKAAQVYQCCFIDTQRIWPKAYEDSTLMKLDESGWVYGTAVHPLDKFNQLIVGKIVETVLPASLRRGSYNSSRFWNLGYNQQMIGTASAAVLYPKGLSMLRATTGTGYKWLYDGATVTFRQNDGIAMQMNFPYDLTANQSAIRGRTGGDGGWNPWGDMLIMNPTSDQRMISQSYAPSTLFNGISLYRANVASGWTHDGGAITERQADGVTVQRNFSYISTAMRVRTGGNTWNYWGDGIIINPSAAEGTNATTSISVTPSGYFSGLSCHAAPANSAFPNVGAVYTLKQFDGNALQINNDTNNRISVRTKQVGDTWSEFTNIHPISWETTITPGNGAGTSPVVNITGSDRNGRIEVLTGTSPQASSDIVVIGYGATFATNSFVVFSPANAVAAALSGTQSPYIQGSGTTGFILRSNSTALEAATVYLWNYITHQM